MNEKVMRKRDRDTSTIGIEIRIPRLLFEVICEYRAFYGYTPQKTIKSVLMEFFKEDMKEKMLNEYKNEKNSETP